MNFNFQVVMDIEYFDKIQLSHLKKENQRIVISDNLKKRNLVYYNSKFRSPDSIEKNLTLQKINLLNRRKFDIFVKKLSLMKNLNKNPITQALTEIEEFKELYNLYKEEGCFIHAIGLIPKAWTEEEKLLKEPYTYFCSLDEIERIINPKNSEDFILKSRVKSIQSNMRIIRYFERKASKVLDESWELSNEFDDSIFENFRDYIHKDYKNTFEEIKFGTIYTQNVNANIQCVFGENIILLNEGLKFFFYYMNIAYSNFWFKNNVFNQSSKGSGLLIGLRTILMLESFDFDSDPRGEIPTKLDNSLKKITEHHLLLILAHELGHHVKEHLSNFNKNYSFEMLSSSIFDDTYKNFNKRKQMEIEADAMGILILSGNSIKKQREMIINSIMIMSFFHIYEIFQEKISCVKNNNTHPTSLERRSQLYKWGLKIWTKKDKEIADSIINYSEKLIEFLLEGLNNNKIHLFYGSTYISQWMPEFKKDRVDY